MDKRVVLITGGSRGIGEAISCAFAKNGDIVVINYLSNKERADAVVAKIKRLLLLGLEGGLGHAAGHQNPYPEEQHQRSDG